MSNSKIKYICRRDTAVMLNDYINFAQKSVGDNENVDIDKLDQNDERTILVHDMLKVWRFLKSIKLVLEVCPPSQLKCAVNVLALSPLRN